MTLKHRRTAQVYQFKIVLNGIKPLIWRRILVPETYSFYDLHVAIQDAMGWENYHLHRFEIPDPLTGGRATIVSFPTEISNLKNDFLPDWKAKISHYFTVANNKALYVYDYLYNEWNHKLTLEGIFPREQGSYYPACLDGRRACPPEDCGGVQGYYRLLKIIKNHKHNKRKEILKFTSGAYDPEGFDIHRIHFNNPTDRLDSAFNR